MLSMSGVAPWCRRVQYVARYNPRLLWLERVCLDLLLLLLALGHVDLEGLVPLDDRAPPEARARAGAGARVRIRVRVMRRPCLTRTA